MYRYSCDHCNGHYVCREGNHGVFAGCSNFPNCYSSKNLHDIAYQYIEQYGVGMYHWDRECWKCHLITPIVSYYIGYELEEIECFPDGFYFAVGLGDIPILDRYLARKYSHIMPRYSHTTHETYMANTCVHCHATQGRNYVVDDPHEIFLELYHDHTLEKFLIERVKVDNPRESMPELKTIIKEQLQ